MHRNAIPLYHITKLISYYMTDHHSMLPFTDRSRRGRSQLPLNQFNGTVFLHFGKGSRNCVTALKISHPCFYAMTKKNKAHSSTNQHQLVIKHPRKSMVFAEQTSHQSAGTKQRTLNINAIWTEIQMH
jgi:hypothetical protein